MPDELQKMQCRGMYSCGNCDEEWHTPAAVALPEVRAYVGRMTEQKELHEEVISQFSTLMTAAFAMVSALAWNAAVQTTFKELLWSTDTVWAQLSYAVVVTIIAVFATRWVVRAENHMNGVNGK